MSGLAGVVHLDGRPVTRALLERLTALVAHRGPDGIGYWTGEGRGTDPVVGLSHQRLVTTARVQDAQPLHDERTGLAVTFDGRLDNRDDLASALGIGQRELASRGDAWLALRGYARWGDDCAGHLLGDFVFALWDQPARRLFCARDPMGIRPFFYHHDVGRRFLFGSELGQVLSAPDVPRQPNEGMLAEYLARAVTDYGETVFSGIHRLPHGTTLSVDASGLRLAPYWNAEPPAELRYRRDDEYAEHFFELFGRAVSCRLDSAGPVAVTLSGGLDSSSVVATIGALSARQEVPPVELFSLVFPDQPVADEWRYAADVARMHALPLHPITPQRPGASSYLDPMARRADLLELPSDQMAQPMKAAIRDRGIRVALTGAGGDHGFSGSVHHYADLIRRGRLMTLVRRLVTDARTEDMGWEPSSLIVGGIWPLVPRSLRALISPVARRIRGYRGYPAWIPAEFATRVGLERRLRPERDETVAGGRAVQEIRREYTSGWVQYHIEQAERCAAEMGIEERQPFFDRRVIEFALALPDEQRWRGTLTKHVIRQALGDHLPPSVRNRPDKSDFTHVAVQSLQALGGRNLFEHLEIASLGWVDQRQIVRLYAEMEQQLAAGGDDYDIFGLWMVAGVELWFRAMFGRERETAVAADPVAVAV